VHHFEKDPITIPTGSVHQIAKKSYHFHTESAHYHAQIPVGAVNNVLPSLGGEKGCSVV
jgi:hypothetical protein